jgi:hypothetical protein
MRSARLLVGLIAAAAVLALPAAAKEGVRARLDAPVRLDTASGKTIRVAWHLFDEKGRPFGAGGIYLRVSRCGHGPLRIPAVARGRGGYSVRLRVPSGGVRKLLVGLRGVRIIGNRRERADLFFQFDPPLHRDCS